MYILRTHTIIILSILSPVKCTASNGFYIFNFLSELGMAQRKFAQCLGEFQFEYIGDAKTDDEKCIGKCGFDANKPLVLL